MAEEGLERTENELIHIGKPIPFDTKEFLGQLEELAMASYENSEEIVEMVESVVTTFSQKFRAENNIASVIFLADRVSISNRDCRFNHHDCIWIYFQNKFDNSLYSGSIKIVLFAVIVCRCCNDNRILSIPVPFGMIKSFSITRSDLHGLLHTIISFPFFVRRFTVILS